MLLRTASSADAPFNAYLVPMKKIICLLLFALLGLRASATVYYVSQPSGNDNDNGLTPDLAFKTIQKAANLVLPGDVVNVMNGTYTNACPQCNVATLTHAGTSANWITFQNYAGHVPVLQFNSWQAFGFGSGAAYIRITGFEIVGNNANVTLVDALNQPKSCNNPTGSPDPIYNGNGIAADGRNAALRPHHLWIDHNIVHDCGGAGISAIQCDYITIEDNLVYNNSWYTIYGTSGISLLNSWNSDGTTNTHNFVRRNRCFGNRLYVPWAAVCQITDGNGIIIDYNQNSQAGSNIPAYTAHTLVENNIVWNNGGSGIHAFKSDHVTILHNTAYQNSQSAEINNGEIYANSANDIQIINNLLWAADGNVLNTNFANTNLTYDYNLHWGGNGVALTGTHTITSNPILVQPALDLTADFHLQTNSPAINAGDNANSATADFDGTARPNGPKVDMGAFESSIVLSVEYLAALQGLATPPGIDLRWATATERDASHFVVQCLGTDAVWMAIGEVAAQGVANIPHLYRYVDKNPINGLNYYRLRQIDRDGASSFSNIVAVEWKPLVFKILPNPVTDHFSIQSELPWTCAVLFDMQGRRVRTFLFSEQQQLDGLEAGAYWLAVFGETNRPLGGMRVVKAAGRK